MKTQVLIVDDEPLARERLRQLVEAEPELELAGEFTNGREAVTAIRKSKPDLLFLDVQMPELDGFGVLEELGSDGLPVVIFVTAHDRFALRAFEVHALDYLLKPVSEARFGRTIARLKRQLSGNGARRDPSIAVTTSRGTVIVPVSEIEWIEAENNYSRLWTGNCSYLLREPMRALEGRSSPLRFEIAVVLRHAGAAAPERRRVVTRPGDGVADAAADADLRQQGAALYVPRLFVWAWQAVTKAPGETRR